MHDFKTYLLSMRIAGPKAVDFYIHWVTQFYRYHRKDRETVLPDSLKRDLQDHLAKVRRMYDADRGKGANGVMVPGALEKKYPLAGQE